ncbi:MAG: histidine kinase [Eubacteriales bacterium]|nr:histidine kinase [Eubacteriales bacterium]
MRAWIARSFRNRIFITVLLVALVPLLLCDLLMTQMMIERSEQTLRREAQTESTALSEQLDTLLGRCTETTQSLAESTVTRSALRRGGDDSRTLYQLLHRNRLELRGFADFEVYDADGQCLYTTAAVVPAPRSVGWGVLCAARQSDDALCAEDAGLTGASAVTASSGEILGYVVFRMERTQLDAFFAPLLSGADEAMLVDRTWRMAYATQPLRAEETLVVLREQLLSGRALTGGGEDNSYYVRPCGTSGFSLILRQPRTFTVQAVRSIYFVAGVMGALCLVLCLVCAWWLSRRLSEPVDELDSAMRRVEGGDYDVRIESTRQDEMGRLAASFDRMTGEYSQNLKRSVRHERELNETRLRMLQSQLNPHFLYNTLDCMKWLGVTNGAMQVATLATDLAALLRAGISGSEYILLEEELELIERYLDIQEIRFGDRFVCEIDVDERFRLCIVPKLILQPLVENAIIHGVSDSDEGFIKLWAEADGGDLLLKVSDNGSGIPEDVLRCLNSHETIPGGHLGLNNVDRIVRLSYGAAYGLSAYPIAGGGSCVQLRLPMQKGEDYAQGSDR